MERLCGTIPASILIPHLSKAFSSSVTVRIPGAVYQNEELSTFLLPRGSGLIATGSGICAAKFHLLVLSSNPTPHALNPVS